MTGEQFLEQQRAEPSTSSRRRFVGQVALGVFASIPAVRELVKPGVAKAVPLCQDLVCHYQGGGLCCPGGRSGLIYNCYDAHISNYFCQTICVLDGGFCV